MDRTPVSSSSLASVGYDEASRTLEIEFRKGSCYRYVDVPPVVYRELLGAESLGRYFLRHIRDSYEYTRL